MCSLCLQSLLAGKQLYCRFKHLEFAEGSLQVLEILELTGLAGHVQTAFIALLGSVTLEVCLTARYWTWFFGVIVFLSYWLVYPFELLFPVVEMWIKSPDPAQYGVARHIFSSAEFWLIIVLTNTITFGHR